MTKTFKKSVAFLSATVMVMAMLLYFPSGMFSNIDWGLKASAEAGTQTTNGNWINFAATEFAGGTGIEGDPYQIATAEQLAYLAQQVNNGNNYSGKYFKLTADINLDGKEWTPIGTDNSNAFTGNFSGGGKKITNLTINSESNFIGLFGFSEGTIMNVGIEGGSVTGGGSVGGVCGYNNGGTISNCYNTGIVTGNADVGGVCGYNCGTISNCYNTGNVSGSGNNVGGVCGFNEYGTIANCYNTGDVSRNNYVGGVCGYNQGGTITNCYYLDTTATKGIGSGSGSADPKTLNELCGLDFGDTDAWTAGSVPNEVTDINGRFGKKVYTLPSLNGVGTALTTELNYYNFGTTETAEWLEYTPITDAAGLQAINNNLSGKYVLMNDIDLSTVDNFTPIGTDYSNAFTGKFSGNGHKIKNLKINSESNYIGLFGCNKGKITNVGIEGGSVTGKKYVGGVCGDNCGTISNCYNTASVTGGEYVGGVCGENYQGTISNCYNTDDIIGKEYTGSNSEESATPEESETPEEIGGVPDLGSGSETQKSCNVGGVCGSNNEGTITNCYNTGEVTSGEDVGGVCGSNGYNGTITNCYNTGKVTGENKVGGVCGSKGYNSQTSNCYYLAGKATGGINGSDVDGSAKAIAYTTLCDDTKLPGNFDSSVWAKGQIKGYTPIEEGSRFGTGAFVLPSLIDVGTAQTISTGADKLFYNFGTTDEPDWQDYTPIRTAEQLQAIGKDSTSLGKNYVLMEDIDLKAITNFTPIGTDSSNAFTGKFSGNGHKIKYLTINSESDNVGLFGYSNGTIMNVTIESGSVTGGGYVGGVCGYKEGGTITNCYNTAIVKGTGDFVGGVCGYNFEGTITDCNNTGSVTGGGYVGGVCGDNFEGTITNCYNTAIVKGTGDFVGGVCGKNYQGTISNCYFDSTVYNNGKAVGINENETVSENVLGKTTKQFTSGEVAYLLSQDGSVWGQEIGKDLYPVLGGKKVYLTTGECVYYTNIYYEEEQSHSYKNGICDNCGGYDPAKQNSNGKYEISNAGQLYWFAGLVNGDANVCKDGVTQNASANAVLTANITVNKGDVENAVANCNGKKATGWIDWTPIGNNDNQYTGTFDGNGKTISGLYFSNPDTSYVGLFGCSKGTIKNIGVVDSYFEGKYLVGGVCGQNAMGKITNCYNKGAVSGTEYVGGVCGQNLANVEKATATITNCYNTGTVSGSKYVGGVCGSNYAYNGTATIINCYNTGNVTATGTENDYVGGVCGQNAMGKITNCYYDSTIYKNGTAVGFNDEGIVSENVLDKTTEQFTSGEVAYLLQSGQTEVNETIPEVWGQKIGTDLYPVLDGEAVYRNESYAQCESKPGTPTYSYANTQKSAVYQEHSYVNGICKWCDKPEHQHAVARYVRTNVIESTCTEYGSYTRLAYCSCGQLMTTRNFLTVPKEHDYSSGGICKICGTLKNGKDGFKSASVTLTDGVIINYNLLLSDEALADTGAYIHFTSPQGLDVKIMLSKGVKENDRYKFSLKLRPDQMADLITAQVVYSDGSKGNSVDYSVTKYADNVKNNADSATSKTSDLIDAMLYYGAATQSYTGNNTDNSADENISKIFDSNVKIADDYKMNIGGTVSGIKIKGASLIAGSLTTIKVKYQVTEGSISDFTFTCDGTELTPVKQGNFYYVYIRDISPDNIDKMYSIVVTDKNGNSRTLEYSALTYAKSIIEDTTGKYPESLINMMKALYYYNKAADAYSN